MPNAQQKISLLVTRCSIKFILLFLHLQLTWVLWKNSRKVFKVDQILLSFISIYFFLYFKCTLRKGWTTKTCLGIFTGEGMPKFKKFGCFENRELWQF